MFSVSLDVRLWFARKGVDAALLDASGGRLNHFPGLQTRVDQKEPEKAFGLAGYF